MKIDISDELIRTCPHISRLLHHVAIHERCEIFHVGARVRTVGSLAFEAGVEGTVRSINPHARHEACCIEAEMDNRTLGRYFHPSELEPVSTEPGDFHDQNLDRGYRPTGALP